MSAINVKALEAEVHRLRTQCKKRRSAHLKDKARMKELEGQIASEVADRQSSVRSLVQNLKLAGYQNAALREALDRLQDHHCSGMCDSTRSR